jgi:F0F1-type ATP synthase assembly protein I
VTELVVTIVALMFIGRYADTRFNTGSRYMVVGSILGFIAGVYRMYWRLKDVMDEDSGPGGDTGQGQ